MPWWIGGGPVTMPIATVFSDVVAHDAALQLLDAALARQRLAPAYLFCGPRGVGRRLVALRFLEALLSGSGAGDPRLRRRLAARNHPDLLVVEPTYLDQGVLLSEAEAEEKGLKKRGLPQVRLEQVRALSRFVARRPVEGRCCVLIDGAEHMNEAAANALLKTLEEPGDALLVLLAPGRESLLPTIVSRCQVVNFRRLPAAAMEEVLMREASGTGDDPPELLALAAGSPGELLRHRRAWLELDPFDPETLDQGMGSIREALELARSVVEALDVDQQLWLIGWWQQRLWGQVHTAPGQTRARMELLNRLQRLLRGYVQPRLAWEVSLLNMVAMQRL